MHVYVYADVHMHIACVGWRFASVRFYARLLAMVGAERGLSTTRTECANAMRHPGSARCTCHEDAQTFAPFILDFMYQMTILVCVTQLWIIVFVHAAVTASGDNISNACLEEAAASKAAMPGSASMCSQGKVRR